MAFDTSNKVKLIDADKTGRCVALTYQISGQAEPDLHVPLGRDSKVVMIRG